MKMTKKAELIHLCTSNGIAVTKKDSIATLRAKLESSGVPIGGKTGSGSQEGDSSGPSGDGEASSLRPNAGTPSTSELFQSFLTFMNQSAPQGSVPQQLASEVPRAPGSILDSGDTSSQFSDASEIADLGPARKKARQAATAVGLSVSSPPLPPAPDAQQSGSRASHLPAHFSSHSAITSRGKNTPIGLRYSVPESVKKNVLDGKFIAIYKLLPGYENASSPQSSFTLVDGSLRLTPGETTKEKKLGRQPLNISSLVLGLLKYKDILLPHDINRATDMDLYIPNLLEISNKYPGLCYWKYHCYVWDCAFLGGYGHRGIPVDWSVIHPEALTLATAGYSAQFCDACQVFAHATNNCPFQAKVSQVTPSHATEGEKCEAPSPCKAFNTTAGCTKTWCTAPHICSICMRRPHKAMKCRHGQGAASFRVPATEY